MVILVRTRKANVLITVLHRISFYVDKPAMVCWILLVAHKGILLMEWGLLRHYFENFSMQGKNYYFHMEGSTEGENVCMRCKCPREVAMAT